MNDMKYIGSRRPRDDSYSRVTGTCKFTGDIKLPGLLYAKVVMSTHPNADIEIDKTDALAVPGVVAVWTYDDIPKVAFNSVEWYAGAHYPRDEYLLNNRARYVGDRIALVVAESKNAVERGVSKVKVTYHDLPVCMDVDAAATDKVIVNGETNLTYTRTLEYGDWEKAAAEADYIVEDTGSTPRQHHLAMETHDALAEIDSTGRLVVHCPCQDITAVQMLLSRTIGLPFTKIHAFKCAMGGTFGGKQLPMPELYAGYAAWQLKRPVFFYMDRHETMIGSFARIGSKAVMKTAVKKDGTILGRWIDACMDGGAYTTADSTLTNGYVNKFSRMYKFKNLKLRARSFHTNKVNSGAFRAYGGPEGHAVSEVNIEHAARVLHMDSCEFRMKNLVDPDYESDPGGGSNLGNAAVKECLRKGMEAFHWKERAAHIHEKDTDRYAYGVGMACANHMSGCFGSYPDFTNIEVVVNPDNSVYIKNALHDLGDGTIDSMKLVAAEALDMPPENITLTEADTDITPYDPLGTQASRVTIVTSGALEMAGKEIRKKLFDTLVQVKGCKYDNLYTDAGKVYDKATGNCWTYGDVSIMREDFLSDSLRTSCHYEPKSNPAAYAVDFIEVKVDKKTGLVSIEDFLAVHDIGRAVNPMLVEGQVEGGAQNSLALGLSEELVYDSKGNMKNGTLSKYHTINVQDMPDVRTILVESKDRTSPYGVKSCGEMTAVAPAPALANAINNALGTYLADYPFTPEKIIAALQKKEAEEKAAK